MFYSLGCRLFKIGCCINLKEKTIEGYEMRRKVDQCRQIELYIYYGASTVAKNCGFAGTTREKGLQ